MTNDNTPETTGIDWPAVRAALDVADVTDFTESGNDRYTMRAVFLGTVFNLIPSGKFYMPWACSNVTPEEAAQDASFRDLLEKEADAHGLVIESGDGDPCDIFAVEYIESEAEDDSEERCAVCGDVFALDGPAGRSRVDPDVCQYCYVNGEG